MYEDRSNMTDFSEDFVKDYEKYGRYRRENVKRPDGQRRGICSRMRLALFAAKLLSSDC